MTVRADILSIFKAHNGEWISGESLAEQLGVSRTAVWKQIKNLQTEGYQIESTTKKGYRFGAAPDLLSHDEVIPELKTKSFGRDFYIYENEIDSTNNRAKELAAAGYPQGTIVVAEKQTAGRGRRGRSWYSPAGMNVYFSVILRPSLPLKDISHLSLVTAVAVAKTLIEEYGLAARVKWPNDILIAGHKIAGVLIEAVTDMDSVEYIVVGIGLNINGLLQEYPDELGNLVTTMQMELGRAVNRSQVLQNLLSSLEQSYYSYLEKGFTPTLESIRKLQMIIGQRIRLDQVNNSIIGEVVDIDNNGFLKVCDQQGKVHTILSGDITIL